MDPAKPWIKDASGRHTNVMAVLDWPNSDDSDTEEFYTVEEGSTYSLISQFSCVKKVVVQC